MSKPILALKQAIAGCNADSNRWLQVVFSVTAGELKVERLEG
jgi:hypothetical protein